MVVCDWQRRFFMELEILFNCFCSKLGTWFARSVDSNLDQSILVKGTEKNQNPSSQMNKKNLESAWLVQSIQETKEPIGESYVNNFQLIHGRFFWFWPIPPSYYQSSASPGSSQSPNSSLAKSNQSHTPVVHFIPTLIYQLTMSQSSQAWLEIPTTQSYEKIMFQIYESYEIL